MVNLLDVILKLVGSFLVGIVLASWLGVSVSEGSNIFQIILFAIGLTLALVNLKNK